MAEIEFRGFAGVTLRADVRGSPDDPSVLLIHSPGHSRAMWKEAAVALLRAGRHVISIDLRGHGASDWPGAGQYSFDAHVEDIRAVLDQLGSRPAIVAAALSGWIACAALAREGAHLATGLILVDAPAAMDAETARLAAGRLTARLSRTPGQADWDTAHLTEFRADDAAQRVAEGAAALTIPVLFTHADTPAATDAAVLAAQLPGGEHVFIEDFADLLPNERTDAFNAVLLDFLERRLPRKAPEYRSGSDARTLRDALGCFATGVTVVTARAPDGSPVGLTANSFTSVSLDPPLLLVCIGKTSSSRAAMQAATHFAINVLHIGQQPTSNVFARPGADRFSETPWEPGQSDVPVLTNSLATFECARHAVHDGGDHIILVGHVERARFEPRRDPLLYFRGRYRRLHFT